MKKSEKKKVDHFQFKVSSRKMNVQIEINAAQDFKSILNEYSDVNRELTALNSQVKEIRAAKKNIEETVVSFMKLNSIDEAQLPDGSKIIRKVSKRTSPMTKDLIIDVLKTKMPEADAISLVQDIFSKRKVTETETISLSKSRKRTSDALDLDDENDDEFM